MAAGVAGLSEVFTPEAADALFRRGEALREGLNASARDRGAPMQWTGLGSLLCAHFQRGSIRRPAHLRPDAGPLRELFHLDMLERGFYLARRGMVALSLEVGGRETDLFRAAVEEFLETRAPVIDA